MEQLIKLNEDQLEVFDREQINEEKWQYFEDIVRKNFGNREHFTVIDVGGGNGMFGDRILRKFNNCTVYVLDNAENLLQKNKQHDRKKLILASVEDLNKVLPDQKFDLICLNWVLHHFVGNSYGESIKNIEKIIEVLRNHVAVGGAISIYDIMYNGILIDNLPSRIIFTLTAIRNPIIKRLIKAMGANTAGIGVCYLSQKSWDNTFIKTRLSINTYKNFESWDGEISLARRVFLHMGDVRVGHYWLVLN